MKDERESEKLSRKIYILTNSYTHFTHLTYCTIVIVHNSYYTQRTYTLIYVRIRENTHIHDTQTDTVELNRNYY